MQDFLQKIRTHFNVIHKNDFLSLTLINPNLHLDIIKEIKSTFRLMHHIKKQQIIIIESVTFDDQLLEELAQALPESLEEISLDFTGCESLRSGAFPTLFERLSGMELRKLKLDFSEVYDIDDTVLEGLALLLESLPDLEQFYLDLYQVDQTTQDGYLLLAESLTSLPKLTSLHLDFSANPNLTQDNLELFFMNLPADKLKKFQFRILDIDHIGGGSFFTLGEKISQMSILETLSLTISTFSNLNQKGIHAILKQITYLFQLKSLFLNLSNINLAEKMLSSLNLPQSVEELDLDISCNKALQDTDILNLIKNLKHLKKLTINLDFCINVTQDSIQQLTQLFLKNNKCLQLKLPDRKYSLQFYQHLIKQGMTAPYLLNCELNEQIQSNKSKEIKQWQVFQQHLLQKKTNIKTIHQCKQTLKMKPFQIISVLSVIN